MRWSGQFTFVVIFPDKLIPICMVNAMLTDVLARGGMKVHRFVPSHRTGCVEMMVNSSMNSRGNGRPTLNRFVLDKCHLRMNYDMWFSTFSGSLHSAWGFRQVPTTVEDVFVQNNVCWKLVFGELRNLMWRWWRWFCHLHGNLECRLLSSHVHARQQTPNLFQPGFYFNNFVDVKFCGTVFTFLLHVSDWKGMFVDDVKFVFQQQLHGRFFTGTWMTLLSEFDAPARCTST